MVDGVNTPGDPSPLRRLPPSSTGSGVRVSAIFEQFPASRVGQDQVYGLVPVFKFSLGVICEGGISAGGYLMISTTMHT